MHGPSVLLAHFLQLTAFAAVGAYRLAVVLLLVVATLRGNVDRDADMKDV